MLLSRLNDYDLEELARVKTATMPMVEALVAKIREQRDDKKEIEDVEDECVDLKSAIEVLDEKIGDLEDQTSQLRKSLNAAGDEYRALELLICSLEKEAADVRA